MIDPGPRTAVADRVRQNRSAAGKYQAVDDRGKPVTQSSHQTRIEQREEVELMMYDGPADAGLIEKTGNGAVERSDGDGDGARD